MPRLLRSAPGATVAVALPAMLLVSGMGALAIGQFAIAWLWLVQLPGMLVHRAARGRPGTFIADVSLGAATGIMVQLAAWLLFMTAGIQGWLWLYPVPVFGLFAAVPSLRRHWTCSAYAKHLSGATAWAASLALVSVLGLMAIKLWATQDLPPEATTWYLDNYWHLALGAELTRVVPPTVPQVAGEPLAYHWLSHAHVAAMSLGSGIDVLLIFARLWLPMILILCVGLLITVTMNLSGHAWAGVIAAGLAVAGAAIQPGQGTTVGSEVFTWNSPSQIFALAFLLFGLDVLHDALQGRKTVGNALLWIPTLASAMVAKVVVLPLVACGICLAAVVTRFANRRHGLTVAGVALASIGVVFAALSRWTFSSDDGTGIQVFSTIRHTPQWAAFAGLGPREVSTSLLLPGLDKPGALTTLLVLVLGSLLVYVWVLPGLAVLGQSNAMAWVLLGMGIAGWCAMMLVNQNGQSQVYFMAAGVIGWDILAAWGVARLWHRIRATMSTVGMVAAPGLGFAVGILFQLGLVELGNRYPIASVAGVGVPAAVLAAPLIGVTTGVLWSQRRGNRSRSSVIMLTSLAALAGSVSVTLLWRLGSDTFASAATMASGGLAVAAVLTTGIGAGLCYRIRPASLAGPLAVVLAVGTIGAAATMPVAADWASGRKIPLKPYHLSTAEVSAARWLHDNATDTDIIATNVHCRERRSTPACEANAFWLSGLSERRVLVEGWAYTDQAMAANGVNGLLFSQQPFFDQELFALNEAAFYRPSAATMVSLHDRGVRWLFADTHAGAVSPDLASFATPVLQTSDVVVYRLEPGGA